MEFAKALPFEMPSTNALPVTVEEFILETERQTGKVNYTKVVIQVLVELKWGIFTFEEVGKDKSILNLKPYHALVHF